MRRRTKAKPEPGDTTEVAVIEESAEQEQQEAERPKGNWLIPPYEEFRAPVETIEDEKGRPFERPALPEVPSVWREGGYLLLALGTRTEKKGARSVECISTQGDGDLFLLSVERFWSRVAPSHPPALALSLAVSFLARQRAGIFTMRIRDLGRLVEMVTPEKLAELTERELAIEYRKLVDPRGPDRIRVKEKDEAIEKLLIQAREIGAKVVRDDEGKPNKAPKAPKIPKGPKEPKEKKEKKVREPKAKKEPKTLTINPTNPFREGSMKRKAYDVFIATQGDRAKVLEATVALGATKSTASSWFSAFCKV